MFREGYATFPRSDTEWRMEGFKPSCAVPNSYDLNWNIPWKEITK